MKRFVVLVLDGFGIGAMKDTAETRPGDERADTLGSILKDFPQMNLPNLERLGLMNAYGKESSQFWKGRADAFWRRHVYGASGNYGYTA